MYRGAWRRLLRNKAFLVGGALVLLEIAVALLGPALVKGDPFAMQGSIRLQAPGAAHLLGTDEFGRDLLTRIVHGARITLEIGAISVGIAMLIGGTVGLISGYAAGAVDLLVMGAVDVMLAFPTLLVALAIVAILGPSLENTMIAVGLSGVPGFARLVRGSTLAVRETTYVEAGRAAGGTAVGIMARHILPNVLAPIVVLATLQFPAALLSSAALGFVGLGAQPPSPEWGALLVSARNYIRRAPWLVNAPGVAIMITVLGFNLLGNALRDVFDPTQKNG